MEATRGLRFCTAPTSCDDSAIKIKRMSYMNKDKEKKKKKKKGCGGVCVCVKKKR